MIKLKTEHFSGSGKVFERGPDGLAAVLRGLAIDLASVRIRTAVEAGTLTLGASVAYTDSSTGTAADRIADVPLPSAAITADAGSLGAQLSGLNTALAASNNALAVLVERIDALREAVGMPTTAYAGTVALSGTIPAQTKTVTGVNGTTAADFGSAVTVMANRKRQFHQVVSYLNETLVAIGLSAVPNDLMGAPAAGTLSNAATVTAAAAGGVSALSKTDADAYLTGLANSVASLADGWNDRLAAHTTGSANVIAA